MGKLRRYIGHCINYKLWDAYLKGGIHILSCTNCSITDAASSTIAILIVWWEVDSFDVCSEECERPFSTGAIRSRQSSTRQTNCFAGKTVLIKFNVNFLQLINERRYQRVKPVCSEKDMLRCLLLP